MPNVSYKITEFSKRLWDLGSFLKSPSFKDVNSKGKLHFVGIGILDDTVFVFRSNTRSLSFGWTPKINLFPPTYPIARISVRSLFKCVESSFILLPNSCTIYKPLWVPIAIIFSSPVYVIVRIYSLSSNWYWASATY